MLSNFIMTGLAPILRQVPFRGKTTLWKTLYRKFDYQNVYRAKFPEGYSMNLHPEDLWEFLMLAGSYERREHWVLKHLLEPGDTFLDGGANIGYFSCLAASRVKTGRVHAFEPHPQTFQTLKRHAQENAGLPIQLNNAALSDRSGTGELCLLENVDGLHPNQSSLRYHRDHKTQTVQTLALDDYLQSQKVAHVTLAKLDLEGVEPQALRGAKKSLESGLIESLLVEITQDTCHEVAKELYGIPFEAVINLRDWSVVQDVTALPHYLPQPNLLFLRGKCFSRYQKLPNWKEILL